MDDTAMTNIEEINFGQRLRNARKLQGLNLEGLADMAGCSISLLSKIENGKVSPTIPMLRRVARALGITIGSLMANSEQEGEIVVRRAEREVKGANGLGPDADIRRELIIRHTPDKLLQGGIMVMQPNASSEDPDSHAGEKFGFILEGFLEITIGEETYLLGAGDSICFRSELPHSYRNPGQMVMRLLWVNTPPTY